MLRQRRTRDYVIRMPPDRRVKAACEQVRCENWQFGWDTVLDESTPEGKEAANWIRSGASRRDFREMRGGDVTVFRFAPHQRCFTEHRTRPASWLVRAGQQVVSRHDDMSGWLGSLDEHVGTLGEQIKKG